MTVLTPPGYLQGGTYTAKLDRIYLATLGKVPNLAASFSARQGFFGGRVPTYANPSAMNITMSACGAVIANTFASSSGDYLMANDASVQVTLAASSPTLNRYDIIGFQVKDNLFDSSGLNTAVPAVIQGANSAGTPSDPTLPASFIPVVRAVVNATNTSPAALQSLIRKTSEDGGLLRIANVTERAEITAHDGMQIYREDRDWEEIYDGGAWRVQGVAVCSSTADRDTAITNPYNGQIAVTTDTGSMWLRQAATWVRTTEIVESAQSTAIFSLATGAAADIPGVSVGFTTYGANRDVEIVGTIDGDSTGVTDIGIVTCVVDGVTTLAGELHWGPVGRASYAKTWKTTIATAGAHTVKLQGKKSGSTNNFNTYQTHTNIVADVRHA